jgi:plastocyanin
VTRSVRPLVAAMAGFALTLVACGDDAPDQAVRAERAAALAAEFRASQSTTTLAPAAAPVDDLADDAPSVTEPPAPTVPSIEPTGVVVPVVALDNSFRPQVIEISVGDEVLWENRGLNEHNVLSVVGDDWGVEVEDFQPGAIYAHVFTEPGEYAYFCSIHGNETVGMVGTVIVSE